MTAQELEDDFKSRRESGLQVPAAMIEYEGERGIAIMLGENLATGIWLSGEIIVMWEKGEHTILPEEFNLITSDLWTSCD